MASPWEVEIRRNYLILLKKVLYLNFKFKKKRTVYVKIDISSLKKEKEMLVFAFFILVTPVFFK